MSRAYVLPSGQEARGGPGEGRLAVQGENDTGRQIYLTGGGRGGIRHPSSAAEAARAQAPSHALPAASPLGRLCGGSPSTGFESLLLHNAEKGSRQTYYVVGKVSKLAEEEGFEPSYPGIPDKRFSRPPHSTTLPPLRVGVRTARQRARRRNIAGGESGI